MRSRRRFLVGVAVLALLSQACHVASLQQYKAQAHSLAQTSFLYGADGSLITQLHAGQDRVVVPSGQIPQSIRNAVVAIEDKRFYEHHGIDARGLVRAAYIDLSTGQLTQGGSTITQQLVKNLYLGDEKTLGRKITEAELAWQLEDELTKDQILTKYLNTVYFGEGAYGIQAAAQTFFNEKADTLTTAQSALLAGLIEAPTDDDPFLHPKAALGRRTEVLGQMLSQSMISQPTYSHAMSAPIVLHRATARQQQYPDPYFVDYFKQWFLTNPAFGTTPQERYNLLFKGGLRITTTLDPKLQSEAEDAVNSVLAYNADPYGALTSIDPRTGYVRAMVGGRDYWDNSGFARLNLATGGSTGRQAGSAFKPFALVAALENGMTPNTVFPAPASIDIPLPDGGVWHVANAEPSGYGSLSLEQATISSVNTVYAQVIYKLGAEKVVQVAQEMGIRCCKRVSNPTHPLLAYLSAVLGTNEVNTLEMASAYGTFATDGVHVQPVPASLITDAHGNVIWQAPEKGKQVVDPSVISVANSILQKVVLYGTGVAANIGKPQIGKTGTGQDYTNAWFVGAVPQLVTAVWVGYPQGQISMQPPRTRITVYGGTWPAQIWRLFMLRATSHMPVRQFPTVNVQYVSVAVDTTQDPYCLPNQYTLPANIRTLQFISGTEPTKVCKTPTSSQPVTVPSVIGLSEQAATAQLTRAGFNVVSRLVTSSQPTGIVIAQSPSAGSQELQTSTVTITVSKGP